MITIPEYLEEYEESIADPEAYWARIAEQELSWFEKWNEVRRRQEGTSRVDWFSGASLNITVDCLDRHADGENREKIAYLYRNELGEAREMTYFHLREQVNRCANALLSLGVKKGETVTLYMPLSLEQIIAMLACARIGAVHSVVYAGFSVEALRQRITDAGSKVVIVTEYTQRRGKRFPLLDTARQAASETPRIETLVVVNRDARENLRENELDWSILLQQQSTEFEAVPVSATDPLFILYTSGTTGIPKGVVHSAGGYHLYSHWTMKRVFEPTAKDIYWCTADCGWITGHSYIVYGPLSLGMTTVIYEGAPDYPEKDAWWQLIEELGVTIFYTAPTAIRLFMQWGEEYPRKHNLGTLRILGSVGEPLNPEAWEWYNQQVGHGNSLIVDTWWQTETGGHMLVTLPGLPQKPGVAGLPFFGVDAAVVDEDGTPLRPGQKGHLIIRETWPGALQTCWKNPVRYEEYWNTFSGMYFTGDYAIQDEDGYFQVLGRSDDVLSVSGHRIGSAEVENALVEHPAVVESGVIGIPDEIRGQKIIAFVVLQPGEVLDEGLVQDIQDFVRQRYGHHLVPAEIKAVEKLPKTRSGKIVRRLLRAQELGQDTGDTSTLED
jgi:acetyl-CoA synthetase